MYLNIHNERPKQKEFSLLDKQIKNGIKLTLIYTHKTQKILTYIKIRLTKIPKVKRGQERNVQKQQQSTLK